jgi:phosphomannomutase
MSTQSLSMEMFELLKELRKKVAIGFVGGSDLAKITEQLSITGNNGERTFSPSIRTCGLIAYT